MSWCNAIDWETPAGETLLALMAALPGDREFVITLFVSSPLQLAIEKTFVSADVDLFADSARAEIDAAIEAAGLGQGQRDVYIQRCEGANFRTSPRWGLRAARIQRDNFIFILPHPTDLLIAKMHRAEIKDLDAFRLVIARTGHPTEDELREELQAAVDLYRPGFDEELASDITMGTRVVWNEIFGHDINVRREIIAPGREKLMRGYAPDIARANYRAELRRMGES